MHSDWAHFQARSWLSFSLRLVVAGTFLVAAGLKLQDPRSFAEDIANYQWFPEIANVTAIFLPSLELSAALALVLGREPWRNAGMVILAGMLLVFTIAIGRAWALGINLECGCFGVGSTDIGPWPVLRNLGLMTAMALSIWLTRSSNPHRHPATPTS